VQRAKPEHGFVEPSPRRGRTFTALLCDVPSTPHYLITRHFYTINLYFYLITHFLVSDTSGSPQLINAVFISLLLPLQSAYLPTVKPLFASTLGLPLVSPTSQRHQTIKVSGTWRDNLNLLTLVTLAVV